MQAKKLPVRLKTPAGMTLAPGTAVVSALDENHDGAAFRHDLSMTVEDHFYREYTLPDIS